MLDFAGHETFDFKSGNRAGEGDLIIYDREIIQDGHIQLSDKPGLGLDLNKDVAMKYLMEGETWWASGAPGSPPAGCADNLEEHATPDSFGDFQLDARHGARMADLAQVTERFRAAAVSPGRDKQGIGGMII